MLPLLPFIAVGTTLLAGASDRSDPTPSPSPSSPPARSHGYETDPPGVAHRHKALAASEDLEFDVCRCGFVRYVKAPWIAGESFPGYGPWERSPGGLVRVPERSERSSRDE